MPTYRRPKGVYSRNYLDWRFANSAYASAIDTTAVVPGSYCNSTFALYNNDSLGRSLVIYSMSAAFQNAATMQFDFVQGTFGTFRLNGMPNNPMWGGPPGQLYLQSTITTSYGPYNPDFSHDSGIINLGYYSSLTYIDGPIFEIPATWSFRIGGQYPGYQNGIALFYIVENQPY